MDQGIQFLIVFVIGAIVVAVQLIDPNSHFRVWIGSARERIHEEGTIGFLWESILDVRDSLLAWWRRGDGDPISAQMFSPRTASDALLGAYLSAPAGPHMTLPGWRRPGFTGDGVVPGVPATVPAGVAEITRAMTLIDQTTGFCDPYRIPVVWTRNDDGSVSLLTATYTRDRRNSVKHIALTGQTDSGKDTAFTSMALTLMERATSDQVQFAILDGKGLDYFQWQGSPYLWGSADTMGGMTNVLIALDRERMQRRLILQAAKVKSWAEYAALPNADAPPMPLLIVFVSELAALDRYVKSLPKMANGDRQDLWGFLDDHMTTGRSFGMYFVVGAQSFSNTPTLWRRQFQIFIAGQQVSSDDDRPCTGMTNRQIRRHGTVPPSELPLEPGYFCVRFKRTVVNGRAPLPLPGEEHVIMGRGVPLSTEDAQGPENGAHALTGASGELVGDSDDAALPVPESPPHEPAVHVAPAMMLYPGPSLEPHATGAAEDIASDDPLQDERLRIAVSLVRDHGLSPSDAVEVAWDVRRGGSNGFQANFAILDRVLREQRIEPLERRGRRRAEPVEV